MICCHPPQELLLVGYVAMTAHGFALPCFAVTPRANRWHVAACSVDGDHLGFVTGFEPFVSHEIRPLPEQLARRVRVGDPWCDVFLWEGESHVGEPEELWNELEQSREELAQRAPLSLFDIGMHVGNADSRALAGHATEFLRTRHGPAWAAAWLRDTFRQTVSIRLKRMRLAGGLDINLGMIGDIEVIEIGGKVALRVPIEMQRELEGSSGELSPLSEIETVAFSLGLDFIGCNVEKPATTFEGYDQFSSEEEDGSDEYDDRCYENQVLTCGDCGAMFDFSAGEQEFYASKGFSAPKRCGDCREASRAARGLAQAMGMEYGGLSKSPFTHLTSKFAEITGAPILSSRLVTAASAVICEVEGAEGSASNVEGMVFGVLARPVPQIEHDPRGLLLRRLLLDWTNMADDELESALNFLVSHVAVKMQVESTKLLSLHKAAEVVADWRMSGLVPPDARLFAGQTILVPADNTGRWCKGVNGLVAVRSAEGGGTLSVAGIVLVKSSSPSRRRVVEQVQSHLARLARGIRLGKHEWPPQQLRFIQSNGLGWISPPITEPPENIPVILVSPRRVRWKNSAGPPAGLTAVHLDIPYDQLRACGFALAAWLMERIGEKAFPDSPSPEIAAIDALREALRHACGRQLGEMGRQAAATLYRMYCEAA